MRIDREETIGPLACRIRGKNCDAALAVANDRHFGLSSGICTTSPKHAADFERTSTAGTVMVGLPTAGVDDHAPFGGRKDCSCGPAIRGATPGSSLWR